MRNSFVSTFSLTLTPRRKNADILNVGGFSDQVFTLLAEFAGGTLSTDHWVGVIERVEI